VISPTRVLKAQFVAVDSETPLARKVRGMICIANEIKIVIERGMVVLLVGRAMEWVPSYGFF